MRTVELHPAYWFLCHECGATVFVESPVKELTNEQLDELRWERGLDPEDCGVFHTVPSEVECSACGEKFNARPVMSGGDDEEE